MLEDSSGSSREFWQSFREFRGLRSFYSRDFRFLWASTLLAGLGMWMHRLVVSWLVFTLTESPVVVGVTFALYFVPSLFLGPFSGALADRLNRKTLIIFAQTINFIASVLIAAIVIADVAQVWMVLGVVLTFGISLTIMMPSVQTLVYDVVGPEYVVNGIALQFLGMRLTAVTGALGGGIMIETLGMKAAFAAVVVSYGLAILTASFIRCRPVDSSDSGASVAGNLISGLRFFTKTRTLAATLLMAVVAEAFGLGSLSMLPIIAGEEILGVGAGGLGIMNAAVGFGGILGAVALASLPEIGRRGQALLLAFLFYGIFAGSYAQSNIFALVAVLLGGLGLMQNIFDTSQVVLLQRNVPDYMRGRAIGAWILCIGLGPVGPLVLGYLAEVMGVRNAVGISGAIVIATFVLVSLAVPRVRALE